MPSLFLEEEKLKEMIDAASDGIIPEEVAATEPKEELWLWYSNLFTC